MLRRRRLLPARLLLDDDARRVSVLAARPAGQALVLRDGRIVRMQDFADPAKALGAPRP